MSRWRMRKRAVEEPQINLTPMIDVSFVVLIMFIVVAPILEFERIELASKACGHSQSNELPKASPIAIAVNAQNQIFYNKRQVTLNELLLLLKEAYLKNPDARPQIFPDRQAQFGLYQSIKNTVEMAGFSEMDVILKPS